MNKIELKKIIDDHQHYLARDVDGWEKMRADLSNANLTNKILRNVNLNFANLSGANLKNAYLTCANLQGANLEGANIENASLNCANLDGADLTNANLHRARLDGTEMFRKGVILSQEITGWKKCYNGVIVELEIQKGAIVFGISGNKYRTNRCKVISISDGDKGISLFDEEFIYEVGKEIEIENFNLQYNVECGKGIHFFKSREDAENY